MDVVEGGFPPRFPGYRITGELSRTGVSIVYLAQDEHLRRRVVIKALRAALAADERLRQRFLCECRVAASLDHPHVVPIYNVGEVDGTLFVVMPYIRGGDLQALLDARGPLSLAHATSVVTQAAAALDHIHGRGLVHRDVKPKNLLLDGLGPGQRAYLCDFGITAGRPSGCQRPETEAIVPPGSVGFRAPEQVAGLRVDRRTDVYSLGCLLYSCLTAVPPTYAAGLRPDVPDAVVRVLARAMAHAPADRYQTCGQLAADLCRAVPVAA